MKLRDLINKLQEIDEKETDAPDICSSSEIVKVTIKYKDDIKIELKDKK